jgi:uncharacterized protein
MHMSEPPAGSELSPEEGATLARLGAAAVGAALTGRSGSVGPPEEQQLRGPGATFVTLESAGVLRGCIGTLTPARPLYLDVVRNARKAMTDPRLPRVTAADWPTLDVSVSVLSPLSPLAVDGPAALVDALRPGVDGLALQAGGRRATFLPVVWEKLADPARFVAALLAKGGWSGWPAEMRVARYSAATFVDPAPRAPLQ